nr:EOG090X0C0Q [Scapholeberis mucronata]
METMNNNSVRQAMLSYWEQYEPSIESMMLSQDAIELDRLEKEEILSYLPPIKGKSVLELGSGIGRFTNYLAGQTSQLTTVDFIEDYVEKNRQRNGHHTHVDFLRADVTELEFPVDKKYDVIFSNWLLMYLSNDEIRLLTAKMLSWLKDGGYLFVRESCFHPSGNIKLGSNPTFYRSPNEYFSLLQKEIGVETDDTGVDHRSVFELSRANSVSAEENVWHICNFVKNNCPLLLQQCHAVFISNQKQAIPLWNQKHSIDHEGLVVWDYHVIFIHSKSSGSLVYDLDCTLEFPSTFDEYIAKVVRPDDQLTSQFKRKFRVISAEQFLETFASDRSHMVKDGQWLKPPPAYPCIATEKSTNNVKDFISMVNAEVPGQIFDYDDFLKFFGN